MVPGRRGPIDLASSSGEQSVKGSAREVEISEVEEVVEAGARLYRDTFSNGVGPSDFQVQSV